VNTLVAAATESSVLTARALEFFTFQYDFVRDALIASILVGALCGVVGVFLVLRGLSLLGDAAGHATLPGLAVAFILTGGLAAPALLLGALASAFLASVTVGVISRGARARPDAAIGIVLSVFFGAGTVLLTYIQRTATTSYAGLDSMLLGNVAGITTGQLVAIATATVTLLSAVVVTYRHLLVSTFDPVFAASIGVRTRLIHYGLLGALAVTIVVSVQAVGVVLVSAMLITPASAALFLSSRLERVLAYAGIIGAVSGACGAFLSYLGEGVATGPAIVLVASTIFLACMLFGPRNGIARRWLDRRGRTLEVP
jgi:manganese/zinc/iron transport system permease protein